MPLSEVAVGMSHTEEDRRYGKRGLRMRRQDGRRKRASPPWKVLTL